VLSYQEVIMAKEDIMKMAYDAIIEIDEDAAMDTIKRAEDEGVDLVELLSQGFSAGMRELGDRFGSGEVFLPELIFASDVMKMVSEEIESKMDSSDVQSKGVMVIGTVEGDVHDIGKGIVAALVKTNGVEVHDLGREVPAAVFVEKAKEVNADFVGSSALLTTTMTVQKDIEQALKDAGIRDQVKTLVGGAPVTARWADKIGADAYCEDATETVNYVNEHAK
jgi:trimethylamine corrinoid protein